MQFNNLQVPLETGVEMGNKDPEVPQDLLVNGDLQEKLELQGRVDHPVHLANEATEVNVENLGVLVKLDHKVL